MAINGPTSELRRVHRAYLDNQKRNRTATDHDLRILTKQLADALRPLVQCACVARALAAGSGHYGKIDAQITEAEAALAAFDEREGS